MATDMDVDMDIDLGPIDGDENVQNLDDPIQPVKPADNAAPYQDQPVEATPAPHKVHIRGLDEMTTADIEAFASENFPSAPPLRVEWIDDTSANLVYDTPAVGMAALESLSLDSSYLSEPLVLRTAKTLSTHANIALSVRCATTSDQKRARAHETSRFYLMHPEHDPRERRRHERRKSDDGGYRRRRYGEDEHRRRRKRDQADGFDASMYDDNGPSSRRSSFASSSDGRSGIRRGSRRGRGNSRNRSASPGGYSRRRRRTPPPSYRTVDPFPYPTENKGKELFPSLATSGQNGESKRTDLFSDKLVDSKAKKELFPHKNTSTFHRRSDAFDAADETANLFANGMSVPFTDDAPKSKSVADRITFSNSASRSTKSADSTRNGDSKGNGFSIRGTSSGGPDISIRGAATASEPLGGKIRELFPTKINANAGKELFAERVQGRGGRRNRAEDMFS